MSEPTDEPTQDHFTVKKPHELKDMNPDSEAIYDREINPLMTQIITICRQNNIPMMFSCQYLKETQPGLGDAKFVTTRIACRDESETFSKAVRVLFPPSPAVMAMTIRLGDLKKPE